MKLLILLFALAFSSGAFGQQSALVLSKTENDSILIYSDIRNFRTRIIIDSIFLSGNKVTKDKIIFRELTFKPGDSIPAFEFGKNLSRSRENLLNTSLFNFVTVYDSVISGGDFSHVNIHIDFIERWYLWPFPIFEISDRNFNTWLETKDLNRISYGLLLLKENMRGRMEKLAFLLRFGYDETYQLSYTFPYINENQTIGTGLGIGFAQNHEVAFKTVGNKPINFRDPENYMYKRFYSFFSFTHRPSLYHYHLLQFNYNYYTFADTILSLNPDYSFNGSRVNEYLTVMYRYTSDHRDSKVYPLKGDYFEGSLSKSGFGIFKDGDISMMEISGSYRKFWDLPKRLYFNTDWTAKVSTFRDQPYFYQQGMGYGRTFVRGYELYVIDGQSFVLSKNTLKYNLVPTSVKNIKFLKSEKFNKIHYAVYVNWFVDAGYVDDFKNTEGNNLANKLQLGTGFGVDLVTYYDLVLRLECAINKQGETGIFFHLANTL